MNKHTTVYIYQLVDPRNGNPFYVGRAVDPATRLSTHISQARRWGHLDNCSNRTRKYIAEMLDAGIKPQMIILEETTEEYTASREDFWWRHLSVQGFALTNGQPPKKDLSYYDLMDIYRQTKYERDILIGLIDELMKSQGINSVGAQYSSAAIALRKLLNRPEPSSPRTSKRAKR